MAFPLYLIVGVLIAWAVWYALRAKKDYDDGEEEETDENFTKKK